MIMDKILLKENRIHGDVMFPLEVYSMVYTNPNSGLECHWHDELELLIVTKGRAVFQIESATYELNEGQAIFVNSGEIHSGFSRQTDPWGYDAVVFNPCLLLGGTYDSIQNKYIEPLLKKQFIIPQWIDGSCDWHKTATSLLTDMIQIYMNKQNTYELLVKARLHELISMLLSHSVPRELDKDYDSYFYKTERLKKILGYIQTNCHRRINLSELAHLANMSEGHFCRFFKQMVNRTPVDYINYYKINRAARLLEDTNTKILDVAMEVGFDNFSYFINIFKHYMNCTPSQYRKNSKSLT